jgi:hypothetical protein
MDSLMACLAAPADGAAVAVARIVKELASLPSGSSMMLAGQGSFLPLVDVMCRGGVDQPQVAVVECAALALWRTAAAPAGRAALAPYIDRLLNSIQPELHSDKAAFHVAASAWEVLKHGCRRDKAAVARNAVAIHRIALVNVWPDAADAAMAMLSDLCTEPAAVQNLEAAGLLEEALRLVLHLLYNGTEDAQTIAAEGIAAASQGDLLIASILQQELHIGLLLEAWLARVHAAGAAAFASGATGQHTEKLLAAVRSLLQQCTTANNFPTCCP